MSNLIVKFYDINFSFSHYFRMLYSTHFKSDVDSLCTTSSLTQWDFKSGMKHFTQSLFCIRDVFLEMTMYNKKA